MTIRTRMRPWTPVSLAERYRSIDVLRGLSLFGVLMVNLLLFFRISLFSHIVNPPGDLLDRVVAELLEFKAFALFSFTFGIGVAIQSERAGLRGVNAVRFLARRFIVLLGFGLLHLLFLSNVDILTLYAVCGLLLLPLLRFPVLILFAVGLLGLFSILPTGVSLPPADVLRVHAAEASHVYREGSYAEIFGFRWEETRQLIAPLLAMSLQRTFGWMSIGIACWRMGVLQNPERHRRLLWAIVCGAGACIATLQFFGWSFDMKPNLVAAGYAAAIFLWASYGWRSESLAAAGQMALTNYLTQSVILSLLFYGYGLGMFGRLDAAPGALIGVVLYAAQLAFSRAWLRRYRFGPVEWLWRSLTYGCAQPMRL